MSLNSSSSSSVSSTSWKKFGNNTKAGQMLRRLYASKPKISYPKPKPKKRVFSNERKKPFFVQSNARAEDPREKRIQNVHVAVPRVSNRKAKKSYLIDNHKGKRKQVVRMSERPQYRPSRVKGISTQKNKDALQQKFQFGKGKALPQEGMPVPLSPSSLNRQSNRNGRHEERYQTTNTTTTKKTAMSEEDLFKATLEDIEYRRQYMKRLEALGDFSQHATLEMEIKQKIKELEFLDGLISESSHK